jgi:hypothetical protein
LNIQNLQVILGHCIYYNAPGKKLRFLHRHKGAICDREGYNILTKAKRLVLAAGRGISRKKPEHSCLPALPKADCL